MASEDAVVRAKTYLRIDTDDDDVLVGTLLDAATIYLDNAGVPAPAESNALYDLALWGVTLYFYDHRDDVATNLASMPLGVQRVINQLKLMEGEL